MQYSNLTDTVFVFGDASAQEHGPENWKHPLLTRAHRFPAALLQHKTVKKAQRISADETSDAAARPQH
jgi:hypothetical protein